MDPGCPDPGLDWNTPDHVTGTRGVYFYVNSGHEILRRAELSCYSRTPIKPFVLTQNNTVGSLQLFELVLYFLFDPILTKKNKLLFDIFALGV